MVQPAIPYQCLVQCGNVLVAARGSAIDLFNLQDGKLLSTCECQPSQDNRNGENPLYKVVSDTPQEKSEPRVPDVLDDDSSPPAKKTRLSVSEPALNARSTEGKKKRGNRLDAVTSGQEAPAVTALSVTKAGKHVIAITGEDKAIRVFETRQKDGTQVLRQISYRYVAFALPQISESNFK